jgi:hypothetical protein
MTYPVLSAGSATSYFLQRSVRLRSSASGNFSRTPASTTNRKTWTWSAWVKRGIVSSGFQTLFSGGATVSDTGFTGIWFNNTDTIRIGGSSTDWLATTQVFRDPSAWYHIVVVMDTTNATANNRLRLYINGVEVTVFTTRNNLTLNADYGINQAALHYIGFQSASVGLSYFDGYLAEINFIDGQALTPTSFGQFDALTGVWQPKQYAGTYGTNGFYEKFTDNSAATAAAIGRDFSGNGNNWTPNNISVTAGTTYDSMTDVPTLTSTTQANYPTLNSIGPGNAGGTYSNANLSFASAVANQWRSGIATMFLPSGKFYFEATIQVLGANNFLMIGACGIQTNATVYGNYTGLAANGWSVQCNGTTGGTKYNNGGATNVSNATFANWLVNDVLQCAVDVTNGRIWFGKNNTWLEGVPSAGTGASFTNLTGPIAPSISCYSSTAQLAANFGQRPFSYTPPTGFIALNAYNLPTPSIPNSASQFAATLWAGNSTASTNISNSTNGVSFQPDLVWIKNRSSASWDHNLHNSVVGAASYLYSNLTNAEVSDSNVMSAFLSNGFTVGTSGFSNATGFNYVGWQWKGGGTAVTNTSGSITSQVSANPTAGFSVVTYTGTGANATVGHGLGVAPKMMIIKSRNIVSDWVVYHASIGNTGALVLNQTIATSTSSLYWQNTTPTSSVFSIGIAGGVNNSSSNTYVAYCFAEITGYSAFGTFNGNGVVDGPFIYTGFRPAYIFIKRTNAASQWYQVDKARNGYNSVQGLLYPNLNAAEASINWDILSNGFKMRDAGADVNASGSPFIYAAFAENPFNYSLAR